jgi:histone H2A
MPATTATVSSKKKTRQSRSARAGIIFPVARMHKNLKAIQTSSNRVTKPTSVYLAAVIEYLVGMYHSLAFVRTSIDLSIDMLTYS